MTIESVFQILPSGSTQSAGRQFARDVQADPAALKEVQAALPRLKEGINNARKSGKVTEGLIGWLKSLNLTGASAASRDRTVEAAKTETAKIDKGLFPLLGTIAALWT